MTRSGTSRRLARHRRIPHGRVARRRLGRRTAVRGSGSWPLRGGDSGCLSSPSRRPHRAGWNAAAVRSVRSFQGFIPIRRSVGSARTTTLRRRVSSTFPVRPSFIVGIWSPGDRSATFSIYRSQFRLGNGGPSTGIYAGTLRHHNGRFWFITTNVSEFGEGHLLVHAEDPAGPWSDPIFIPEATGIDPDLAWDEDGTCYLTWHVLDFTRGGYGIRQAPLDLSTGAFLEAAYPVWQGSGMAAAEGPHPYRIGRYWYLVLAEGGTERGHAVTVARASVHGDPSKRAPGIPSSPIAAAFIPSRMSATPTWCRPLTRGVGSRLPRRAHPWLNTGATTSSGERPSSPAWTGQKGGPFSMKQDSTYPRWIRHSPTGSPIPDSTRGGSCRAVSREALPWSNRAGAPTPRPGARRGPALCSRPGPRLVGRGGVPRLRTILLACRRTSLDRAYLRRRTGGGSRSAHRGDASSARDSGGAAG